MSDERLAIRLKRLEQQVRSFRELHTRELADYATKLGSLGTMHADELQIILDELADIASELESTTAADSAATVSTDPAAASPKRAKWLAEQERKSAPRSRRELLRGRGEEPKS